MTILIYILLALAVISILTLIYSFVYYRNFLFYIDAKNQEFVLEKGVFTKENVAIPFDRIQQVYTKRSILQRILNVDSFMIETAGSKEEEVEIKAISKPDAEILTKILTAKRSRQSEEIAESEMGSSSEEAAIWIHKLSILTLLKIGISTNYLRGLVLMTGFFATIYNEISTLSEDNSETIQNYLEELPVPMESVSIVMIIAIAVLLMSILITIVEVFIKYFNLQLSQTKDSLQLEMGIKTNTKVSLQPRRVQLLQITTNPIQKWMNLYQARISLANTENDLQKSTIKIPGLDEPTLDKLNSFLFSDGLSNFNETFRPHSVLLIRRLMIALIPVLVSCLYVYFFDAIPFQTWMIFAVIYTIIAVLWQLIAFRSLTLRISEEFIVKNYGVWNKTEERLEIYKMQAVTVIQPLWYQKRNLINIVFHTAGGDIPFKSVRKNILPYMNHILYKIETDSRSWM